MLIQRFSIRLVLNIKIINKIKNKFIFIHYLQNITSSYSLVYLITYYKFISKMYNKNV